MNWDIVIGLEIHAQLNTKTKMFCSCLTKFMDKPNKNTCPVCLGFPGALPVINEKALKKGILTAHAFDCNISHQIEFDRKSYFYPDSPKSFQITQFYNPIGQKGFVKINSQKNGKNIEKKIRINEMHLEDDAGKLIHLTHNQSFVDLNRSGTPLIEIVSAPDIESPEEAVTYFKKVKSILEYINVCDANMEQGQLRCDANISLKPKGAQKLGNRTEIKNMNTFKGLQIALEAEIKRQKLILESNQIVENKTISFDPMKQQITPLRKKVDASGYRYHAEPDLPVFEITDDYIQNIVETLPELPEDKMQRFIDEYGLSQYDATVMVSEKKIAFFYEEAVSIYNKEPKKICNWISTEILSILKNKLIEIDELKIKPKHIAELTQLISQNEITGKIGKEIFPTIIETGKMPSLIVEEKGLKTISDTSELQKIIDSIIENNPKSVEQFKNGQDKVLGFFVGQVMKETKGQANPQVVNKILKEKLS